MSRKKKAYKIGTPKYRVKRKGLVLHSDGAVCHGLHQEYERDGEYAYTILELDTFDTKYQQLRTLLHEHLHLMHPRWSEDRVDKHSTQQALMLWRQRAYLFQ